MGEKGRRGSPPCGEASVPVDVDGETAMRQNDDRGGAEQSLLGGAARAGSEERELEKGEARARGCSL